MCNKSTLNNLVAHATKLYAVQLLFLLLKNYFQKHLRYNIIPIIARNKIIVQVQIGFKKCTFKIVIFHSFY